MIPIPACILVTAPAEGRLAGHLPAETSVRRGEVVATVVCAQGDLDLTAPVDGRIGGPLVRPQQPVGAGEGILWLVRRLP